MAKIIAPNKHYNGISATIAFADGEAYTEDTKLIAWFKSRGYKVEPDENKEKPKPKTDKKK